MTAEAALDQAETLFATQRPLEAALYFERAEHLGADPDTCAGRRWNCYMLAGEYELAWQQSDAIRARDAFDANRVWSGASLAGKRVMVRSLHGYGDAVQMLRYAPLIRRIASRLTLQVAPDLVELARCAPAFDEVVAWEHERPCDMQVEITELPYLLRSTLPDLPRAVPYLQLPAHLVRQVRSNLGRTTKPRIGLVWSSSLWDADRSIPFQLLHPLFSSCPEVEFWCLQPGAPEWNAFSSQQGWPIRRAGDHSVLVFASYLAEMDLIIAIDSFAAHLAGALARPAWILLKEHADWRWMIGREDSPWYPTLRLIRQQNAGGWQPLIATIKRELAAWVVRRENQLTAPAVSSLGAA